MPDLPRTTTVPGPGEDAVRLASVVEVVEAFPTSHAELGEGGTLQVVEERLSVGKRRRSTGGVQVGTRTEVVDAVAEVELDRYRVEVTRVPIGQVVDAAPAARAEGGTTIIPVVEERLVMVKQLFLVEELHVRHVLERETVREPVTLLRQHAVVRRLDGRDAAPPLPMTDDPTSPAS
ncbi:YsnF/AvaK domain-containing protein [Lichenibacterium dinghuense]|uniref:YsnF/AvaK domain-containing protein n=1 Tax=Lichenibacterium dinghuense TaxID=2895977 RepID=UPI001F2FB266|nr:YsnF/AvaK domain-containing protein [Lichenibacterium sp. 6Y81]